ncbi:MAG: hypothetical protein NKF70_01935 [Methanobacterium sp. ERen5]|nr:MAG: hypothetical protein NKF70_01935 [Methanobacterium sp. ERen5]
MKIEENRDSQLLRDEYLSLALCEYNQFLFEKNQYEELIRQYNNFRSQLYNLQETSEDLINKNIEMESDIINKRETAERFEKENVELTKVLEIYNSRKIIRFTNKIYDPYNSSKKFAKKSSGRPKPSIQN